MANYTSLRVDMHPCSEDATDLASAFLCDAGYEMFEADENGLTAYIPTHDFNLDAAKACFEDFPFPMEISFSAENIEGKDWNEEWEKNYFKPIVIADQCVVHSSFHTDVPKARFDIVIDPKMAFGTGHHSTTSLMVRRLLDEDLTDKSVIDMGTGTGILAILAKMKGASEVTGIEIDPDAWENAKENMILNNVAVTMINSDASALTSLKPADYLIANINRNIILADIDRYSSAMKPGGKMWLSGFYVDDIPVILESCEKYGLIQKGFIEDNNWVSLQLVKKQ